MLPVGTPAPDFTLRDQNNQPVRLADLRGRRTVLLVFYPLTFTGICQGELAAIRDDLPRWQNDTVQVLAVSVDSVYAHKVWAERERYAFPILADFWPHGEVARTYGILNEHDGCADRGTFLVDPAGVIRFAEVAARGVPRDPGRWRAALDDLGAAGTGRDR
jgi:peroxiredoxin (alkyl hydroperoxide reductase subunit C)